MRQHICIDGNHLLKLLRGLDGWQNMGIRSLENDQIQKLGKEAIKELYESSQ